MITILQFAIMVIFGKPVSGAMHWEFTAHCHICIILLSILYTLFIHSPLVTQMSEEVTIM